MSKYVSLYVSYKEVIFSKTALRNGFENEPDQDQFELIKFWARTIFDPLREWVGGATCINSIFRGLQLNAKVGGSKTSQHCVGLDPSKRSYGAAGDVDDNFGGKTNAEMGHWIRENLDFDQLIYEFPDEKGAPAWIHISTRPDGKNRKQVLIAQGGKDYYIPYYGNEHRIAA